MKVQRFKLQEVTDTFCQSQYLCPPSFFVELEDLESTNSTNALLLNLARNGAPFGTVIWAHSQTGGRGRLGRSFSSPPGGVYLSLLVPAPLELDDIGFALTAKAGVATKRAIESISHKKCGIKWVNDIIVEDKKVCGILAQMVELPHSQDALYGKCCNRICTNNSKTGHQNEVKSKEPKYGVVIGIGVNYTTPVSSFSDDIKDIATSLFDNEEEAPPMKDFVFSLLGNVLGLICGKEHEENWLKEYKNSSTILGNKVKVIQAGSVVGEGTAVSIDDKCHLHVLYEDGKEIILSTGEVSVRRVQDS